MNKTPHYWAIELVHKRLSYGELLEKQPAILALLKRAMFEAAEEVIGEAMEYAKTDRAGNCASSALQEGE